MLPFGGNSVRHFKKSPCSRMQCATCTVSRADALWQEATGAGASLLVLFQMNTLGLVFVVLPSYSELFALRISNNFSLPLACLDRLTLPVSQPPPAFSEGHETDIVPVVWAISGVSYPSEGTVPLLLSSMPSAAPPPR